LPLLSFRSPTLGTQVCILPAAIFSQASGKLGKKTFRAVKGSASQAGKPVHGFGRAFFPVLSRESMGKPPALLGTSMKLKPKFGRLQKVIDVCKDLMVLPVCAFPV